MAHAQGLMQIECPLEADLSGKGITLCLQTRDGRKFILRGVVRDVKEASGGCQDCRSFAPIESFSVAEGKFGMALTNGGHITIYGPSPVPTG